MNPVPRRSGFVCYALAATGKSRELDKEIVLDDHPCTS
jgi:hypothetical protein